MVHTENVEKKKDNKEVKKKHSRMEIFISIFFFTRREIQKEMTNQETQGISKKKIKNEFKKKEVNEEERKRKRRWRQSKGDGEQETREG